MAESGDEQTKAMGQRIEGLLNEQCEKARLGFRLSVVDSLTEDDWTYFVVKPDRDDVRVYDYSDVLAVVETSLRRDQHIEHVLLVPAIAA